MSICKLNFVIFGSQVARCGDEVNVMVGIIILLELNGLQLEASQRIRRRDLINDLL